MTAEDTIDVLRSALEDDVTDSDTRHVYADALADDGQDALAAVHHELAELGVNCGLTPEENAAAMDLAAEFWDIEPAQVGIRSGLDDDLLVVWFQVYRLDGRGDDEKYVVCRGRGDLRLGDLRRRAGLR